MANIIDTLGRLGQTSGFFGLFSDWRQIVMIVIACILLYLGLVKKFEPLLLVGIAFGMLLTNLPFGNMYNPELWDLYIANGTNVAALSPELQSCPALCNPKDCSPPGSSAHGVPQARILE